MTSTSSRNGNIHAIHHADNLSVLANIPDATIPLIYIDPPFNTGKRRAYTRIRSIEDPGGDRLGFTGRRYRTIPLGTRQYIDVHDDYLGFIEPRLTEAHRVLAPNGTLYFHIDHREVHYCKVLLDAIFGRRRFLNEVVWAYDFGARPRTRWPPKHDTILVYAKDHRNYVFNHDEIERIPYLAPGLVGPEKARRGKIPTDVWWQTIVPTGGRERVGYPTQKPIAIARRIIQAASHPGDTVLDFFAGSGTTGAAAIELGRRALLVDDNPQAIAAMKKRFAKVPGIAWHARTRRTKA